METARFQENNKLLDGQDKNIWYTKDSQHSNYFHTSWYWSLYHEYNIYPATGSEMQPKHVQVGR
jgi:hypothetical protein